MKHFRVAGFALLAFALGHGEAHSDSFCDQLALEKLQLSREKSQLVNEYPGTLAVIGFCLGAGQNDPHAAMGCIAAGCLAVVGPEHCVAVATRVMTMQERENEVAKLRAGRC